MIERIDLLMPPEHRSGYGVLPQFTRGLYAALQRQGVECRLLGNGQGATPDLVPQIVRDPPDCTLSFNGLLPDGEGRFFCDQIQVPHVACLVDSPNQFLSLVQSPLNLITCVDQAHVQFFSELHKPPTLFLPHAVERDFTGDLDAARPYEVVFFGTCLDYEERRELWHKKYSPALARALDDAADIALGDQVTSYLEAFTRAVHDRVLAGDQVDLNGLDMSELFDHLEVYIRGRDRVQLLRAITEVPVYVFGTKSGARGWDYYLADAGKNIHVQERVSYEDALALMQQSRVVINSCPTLKQGAHERIHAGFMAGAAVFTSENEYLMDQFTGRELLTYTHDDYSSVNDTLCRVLENDDQRKELVVKGRDVVRQHHTWDHRAETLITYLTEVLPTVEF